MNKFNGVGIFTFAHQQNWYITAVEDLGVTAITYDLIEANVHNIRTNVQNGCELPPLVGLTNFKLSVNSKHLDLEVKQGSNITPCIQKLKLQNFGKSAYFGLTASNPPDTAASSIDLHRL